MGRLIAIIGVTVLCLGLNSPAADKQIDFSGKWILNDEKSDPSPRTTVIGSGADVGRGGTRGVGNRGGIGGGMSGGRVGAPAAGSRAGGNVEGGRIGGGMVNPNIGVDRGTFDSESRVARDFPIVITQTGTELRIVSTLKLNDKNLPNVENYRLDGDEHEETIPFGTDAETKRIAKAKINKNKIEIEITTYNPLGKKFRTNKELLLSKDGKTLTMKVSVQSPNLLTSEKRVYEKQ